MENSLRLSVVDRVESADVAIVNRLLSQLSDKSCVVDLNRLREIAGNNNLLFASIEQDNEDVVVGMVTVSVCDLATGRRGCVDDVVIDQAYRGRGFGAMLVAQIVEFAKEMGCDKVFLTSSEARVAANGLYTKCGFHLKQTNVYVMDI